MDNFRQIMEQTELIADAIIKRMSPISDDLSTNEAERLYGQQWLRQAVASGKVKGTRMGTGKTSKVIYSRHELDCLRYEQREKARLILETK